MKLNDQELMNLEQEWRIKLKQSGFNDIEKWDNRPNRNLKQIKFLDNFDKLKQKALNTQTEEYYRVIGLYAHHAPSERYIDKYREFLKLYAMSAKWEETAQILGYTRESLEAVKKFTYRNLSKMLVFVNQMKD